MASNGGSTRDRGRVRRTDYRGVCRFTDEHDFAAFMDPTVEGFVAGIQGLAELFGKREEFLDASVAMCAEGDGRLYEQDAYRGSNECILSAPALMGNSLRTSGS